MTFVTTPCPHCSNVIVVELAVRRPAPRTPKQHKLDSVLVKGGKRAVDEFSSGPIRGKYYVDDGKREVFDYPAWEDAPG